MALPKDMVCLPYRPKKSHLRSLDQHLYCVWAHAITVHHLELKLRELQEEKIHSPLTLSHPASDLESSTAIHHPRPFEGSWSSPGPQQSDFGAKHSPLRSYPAQHLINGSRGYESKTQPRPSSQQFFTPTPIRTGQRPLLFKNSGAKNSQATLQRPDLADPALFGSKPASSFVNQIQAALDSRTKTTREHQAPRLSGVPLPQLPMMQPKLQDAPRIEYVLPSRKMADTLLEVYRDVVHPLYPFLDRRVLQNMYDGIWAGEPSESDESLMMCTLNVVFALASQFSESLPPKERESSARKYFDRAQDLLSLDLWGLGSVQLVQCLLLLGQYLQGTNSFHQAWVLTGLTVRIAEGLGLHLPETSISIDNVQQRELVRRVWHACVLMDRAFSLHSNRPTMIDRVASQLVPLPAFVDQEHMDMDQADDHAIIVAFYVKTLELYEITTSIAPASLPFLNRGGEYFTSREPYHLFFGDLSTHNLAETLNLDRSLTSWASSLPSHLRIGTTSGASHRNDPVFRRQANVLYLRYLHARLLLFRPILSRYCLASPETNDPSAPSFAELQSQNEQHRADEALPYHLALTFSSYCLRAAHSAIQLIHSTLDQSTITGPVPGWWDCVLFTYSAATVLQAGRLPPSIQLPGFEIETSWHHAVEIIRALGSFSPQVQRCRTALEILDEKITGTIAATTATTGSGSGEVGESDDDAENLRGEGRGGERDTEGLGNAGAGEDGGDSASASARGWGVDFDLSDMTWLISTPMNL